MSHSSPAARISLGEPDGTRSERLRAIAAALIQAGLRVPATARFRQEIWVKLLGNVAFNPISALTRATLVRMARVPGSAQHGFARGLRSALQSACDLQTKSSRGNFCACMAGHVRRIDARIAEKLASDLRFANDV